MNARHLLPVLMLLLLAPGFVRAAPSFIQPGIQLYENGEYEVAAQFFRQVLDDPQRSSQERGEACVYLAASLHAQGRLDEAWKQLEVLARENPEQQVDAVRFLPELVTLAREVRQRVDAEREFARKEAERERLAREEALRRAPPPAWLRPEALMLCNTKYCDFPCVGLAYHQGRFEGGARVMLVTYFSFTQSELHSEVHPQIQLQGGVLGRGLALSSGALQPHVGLRVILQADTGNAGGGAVLGGRYTLSNGFVALLDVSANYFFVSMPNPTYPQPRFDLTLQAGLGFDVRLPSGE
jgi:tetratricopeptide (TPR) repeat protein